MQCQGNTPLIVGRTFDLKSAYKQFGLRTEDRDRIRIATVDPIKGKPIICELNALPFGSCEFLWSLGLWE